MTDWITEGQYSHKKTHYGTLRVAEIIDTKHRNWYRVEFVWNTGQPYVIKQNVKSRGRAFKIALTWHRKKFGQ